MECCGSRDFTVSLLPPTWGHKYPEKSSGNGLDRSTFSQTVWAIGAGKGAPGNFDIIPTSQETIFNLVTSW